MLAFIFGFIKKHIAWLLVLIGSVGLVWGLSNDAHTYSKHAISFGQAIVAGGVGAVLLNTWQYLGLFKTELEKIIYSDEFMSTKNDLPSILGKVTKAICTKNFPKLSDSLHDTIVNKYIPIDKNFHYEDYHYSASVDWAVPEKFIISSTEQTKVKIIPISPDVTVSQNYSQRLEKTENEDRVKTKLLKLTVNGKNITDDLDSFLKRDEVEIEGITYIRFSYELKLTGEDSYDIERVFDKEFFIIEEPVSKYTITTLLLGSKVNVSIIPDDLRIKFMSIGTTVDFKNDGMDPKFLPDKNKIITKAFDGIMFPSQGFLLHYAYNPVAVADEA